jgi:signal peptidase
MIEWSVVMAMVVILVIPAIIALISGTPVGLSYVTSGSMAPTIEAGEGFIAIPDEVAGPPSVGDVIVYDAEGLNDGGYVTHRIVSRTEEGYITAGDANPFTDQDAGEPMVQRGQVVAIVVTLGGLDILSGVLPGALSLTGTSVLSGLFWAGVGLIGLGAALSWVGEDRRSRSPDRRAVLSSGGIILILTAVVIGALTLSMAVGTGPTGFQAVSATGPTEAPVAIPAGESGTVEYTVQNRGVVPMTVLLTPTSPEMSIPSGIITVPPRGEGTVRIEATAPTDGGPFLWTLFTLSPWLPIVVIDIMVMLGLVMLLLAIFGRGPLRIRQAGEGTRLLVRFRRRLRR